MRKEAKYTWRQGGAPSSPRILLLRQDGRIRGRSLMPPLISL